MEALEGCGLQVGCEAEGTSSDEPLGRLGVQAKLNNAGPLGNSPLLLTLTVWWPVQEARG